MGGPHREVMSMTKGLGQWYPGAEMLQLLAQVDTWEEESVALGSQAGDQDHWQNEGLVGAWGSANGGLRWADRGDCFVLQS